MNKSNSQKGLPLIVKAGHSRTRSKGTFSSSSIPPSSHGGTRSQFQDSFHNLFEEEEIKKLYSGSTGSQAKLEFFDSYRNITRLSERVVVHHAECTSNIAYLANLQKNHLRPKSFGIVKRGGSESVIDIHMLSMGDKYADAFSQGLKHYPLLETLNVKSNRLTDVGNEKILASLDKRQLKRLNLAENKVGPKSLEKIIDIMSFNEFKLKHLNLENTGFNESLLSGLCSVLEYNKRLTKLILARNNLNDSAAKYFKQMLIRNKTLKVLDLHWNNFGSKGGSDIFEGIAENHSLHTLDLSWNSIGKNKTCSEIIGRALKKNTSLLHLDLSYNSLTDEDCGLIGEYLNSNHTLIGIHMNGNACTIDAKGFIHVSMKFKLKNTHLFNRMTERQNHLKERNINCWLCEKWIEYTFLCESPGKDVFIHLDIDNFEPEPMKSLGENKFEISRMVPAKQLQFFFSDIKDNKIYTKYKKLAFNLKKTCDYCNEIQKTIYIDCMEIVQPEGDICNIKSISFIKPRMRGLQYMPPETEMERIKWTLSTSIFKDYRLDSEKILLECFEFDWHHSRISNFVRNSDDQEKVKNCVKHYYPLLKLAYKTLSAYGGSDIFSIGTNIFTDFMNECKIVDNLYGLSDFGVNLNSTLIQKEKGQLYNPGNSLVRYEFIEILVRIAGDRYVRNKIYSTINDSIERLIKDHLISIFSKFRFDKWRLESYLCEEVDLVLRANKEVFNSLFKKYSGKRTLPGKKKFMSLEEFRSLCTDAGLIGDNFATREVDVCFNQAMMTQIDELYSKKHMEMSYVEMLEAISRALDSTNSIPDLNDFNCISLIQTNLSKKIEAGIDLLIKICPQSFQDDYEYPKVENYSKMMYKARLN